MTNPNYLKTWNGILDESKMIKLDYYNHDSIRDVIESYEQSLKTMESLSLHSIISHLKHFIDNNQTTACHNNIEFLLHVDFNDCIHDKYDSNMFSRFDDMPIRLITSYSTLQLFSITANEIIMHQFIAGVIEYFIIA